MAIFCTKRTLILWTKYFLFKTKVKCCQPKYRELGNIFNASEHLSGRLPLYMWYKGEKMKIPWKLPNPTSVQSVSQDIPTYTFIFIFIFFLLCLSQYSVLFRQNICLSCWIRRVPLYNSKSVRFKLSSFRNVVLCTGSLFILINSIIKIWGGFFSQGTRRHGWTNRKTDGGAWILYSGNIPELSVHS